MTTFKDRVHSLWPDLNAAKIAEMIGISQMGLSKIFNNGHIPKAETLLKIHEKSGCDLKWLMTGEGEPFPQSQADQESRNDAHTVLQERLASTDRLVKQLAANQRQPAGGDETTDTQGNPVDIGEFVFIPYYTVALSAGNGSWVDSERPTHTLAFRRDWLATFVTSDVARLSVVKVTGDSMVGVFNDKDTILIDHGQTEPHDGLYAVRIGSEVFVKRVQRLPEKLQIISANPAYPPFEISAQDADNFAIIGKVVWLGRLL